MLKLCLVGHKGRMGQAICAIAENHDCAISMTWDPRCSIQNQVNLKENSYFKKDEIDDEEWHSVDVFVNFSSPHATSASLEKADFYQKPILIGTTGHNREQSSMLESFGKKIPIFHANNFSIGVHILFYLCRQAATLLPSSYNTEILEWHHIHKKDAPSGTALELARKLQAVKTPYLPQEDPIIAKNPIGPPQEIPIHSIRGGNIVGEHSAFFMGPFDRLELTHRSSDRKIFAEGALQAAHWLYGKSPGLYSMDDMLGFNP